MTVAAETQSQGLLIRGRILRWGPVPPASGPARTQWCAEHGLTALMESRRSYGTALRQVMAHLPNGPRDLPPIYPLHLPHSRESALKVGRTRVRSWFSLRRRLNDLDEDIHMHGLQLFDAEWQAAKKASRAALQNAADSYNWLDDARHDLDRGQLIDIASFTGRPTAPRSLGDLIDLAHTTVHSLGEMVGGLFGCRMTYEDGRWYDECIVSLLHLRFGNSPGLWVRYECSVCRKDPGDCAHEPGISYPLQAARTVDDDCTICGEAECSTHQPGTTYEVAAHAKLADPKLREVSLTPRPRDPLARISSRSVDDEDLRQRLGRLPKPDEVVLDHSCMYPCLGFSKMPG